jgi:anti-anti-sigma factor
MHVEIRKAEDVVIVDLKGKLTAGLGDQILRDTIDALLAEGWTKLVLNLSDVTTLDSAGLGELVAGGGRLKLFNANERVHSTIYIARLLPIFETYATEKDALAAF